MSFRTHSFKVVQLAMVCNGEVFGHGTGFFCLWKNQKYLVTNNHVVSGLIPGTKTIIDTDGAVPDHFNIDYSVVELLEDKQMNVNDCSCTLKLFRDNSKPFWIEHPTLKNACDVVAIHLPVIDTGPTFPKNSEVLCIDIEAELKAKVDLQVMDRLFVSGFPMVKEKTYTKYPIYKSGFLASEPDDAQNGPQFYVDAKTKKGMSGSPVIRYREPEMSVDQGAVCFSKGQIDFVGVYSGRANPASDEYTAELGIVWPYKDYLVPILKSHKK